MAHYLFLIGEKNPVNRLGEGKDVPAAYKYAMGTGFPETATAYRLPKSPKYMSKKAMAECEKVAQRRHFGKIRRYWAKRVIAEFRLSPADVIYNHLDANTDCFESVFWEEKKDETFEQYRDLVIVSLISINAMEKPEGWEFPDWEKPTDKQITEALRDQGDETELEDLRDELNAMKMKDAVRERLLAKFKEYADEAEHQDGDEYWSQFKDADEVIADLIRYITNE